jgi:hypothetical protein
MSDIVVTLVTDDIKVLKTLVKEKVGELKSVLSDKHFPGNSKESGEYAEYMILKNVLKKLK